MKNNKNNMRKYVEIYKAISNKVTHEVTQEEVGICYLSSGSIEVKCEGRDWLIDSLSKGILDYKRGGKVFFKDSSRFLENLKFNFKTFYLTATRVKTIRE